MNELMLIIHHYGLSHLITLLLMIAIMICFDWERFYYEEATDSEQKGLYVSVGVGLMGLYLIGLLYLLSPIYVVLSGLTQ